MTPEGKTKSSNILHFKRKKLIFQIENHHELFRLGESYLEDFSKGITSYGFSSIGYEMSQKRTMFGLACFFEYKNIGKVAIISDSFDNAIYSELIKHSQPVNNTLGSNVARFADSIDMIEMTALLQAEGLETIESLREALSEYDLVLWDLPNWMKIKERPEQYLAMILHLQSLSVIVTPSLTKDEEIKRARRFFSDYGVSLKGFILATHSDDSNSSLKVGGTS